MENDNLSSLEAYKLARELSDIAWDIYIKMDWQTKKIIGDQFISAIDSIGANIAEGYGRYHFLDKIKFMYNARGSYIEGIHHWTTLLYSRKLIDKNTYDNLNQTSCQFISKLNAYINYLYKMKAEHTSK